MTKVQQNVWDINLIPGSGSTTKTGKPGYKAVVRNAKIVYDVENVVDQLAQDGHPIDKDDAVQLIHRFVNQCKKLLLQGYSVKLDDLIKIWGKVDGDWDDKGDFTGAVPKKTVAVGSYAAFTQDLDDVIVNVAGIQADPNESVQNIVNKKNTAQDDDYIYTSRTIKADELTVFLIDQFGNKFQARCFDTNVPGKVDLEVSDTLPLNQLFDLEIVTRVADDGSLLGTPRTVKVPFKLSTFSQPPVLIGEDDEEEILVTDEEDEDDEGCVNVYVDDEEIIAEDPDEEDDDDDDEFFVEVIDTDEGDDDDLYDDDEEIIAEDTDEEEIEVVEEDDEDDDEFFVDVIVPDDEDEDDLYDEEIIAEDPDEEEEEEEYVFTTPVKAEVKAAPQKTVAKPANKVANSIKPAPIITPAKIVKK